MTSARTVATTDVIKTTMAARKATASTPFGATYGNRQQQKLHKEFKYFLNEYSAI